MTKKAENKTENKTEEMKLEDMVIVEPDENGNYPVKLKYPFDGIEVLTVQKLRPIHFIEMGEDTPGLVESLTGLKKDKLAKMDLEDYAVVDAIVGSQTKKFLAMRARVLVR